MVLVNLEHYMIRHVQDVPPGFTRSRDISRVGRDNLKILFFFFMHTLMGKGWRLFGKYTRVLSKKLVFYFITFMKFQDSFMLSAVFVGFVIFNNFSLYKKTMLIIITFSFQGLPIALLLFKTI